MTIPWVSVSSSGFDLMTGTRNVNFSWNIFVMSEISIPDSEHLKKSSKTCSMYWQRHKWKSVCRCCGDMGSSCMMNLCKYTGEIITHRRSVKVPWKKKTIITCHCIPILDQTCWRLLIGNTHRRQKVLPWCVQTYELWNFLLLIFRTSLNQKFRDSLKSI